MYLPLVAPLAKEALINQHMQALRGLFGRVSVSLHRRIAICPHAISAVWGTRVTAPEHSQLGGTLNYQDYMSTRSMLLCDQHIIINSNI